MKYKIGDKVVKIHKKSPSSIYTIEKIREFDYVISDMNIKRYASEKQIRLASKVEIKLDIRL